MIKLTKPPIKDRDVDLSLLKSKVMQKLYTQFDSFAVNKTYPMEIIFVDPHKKYFFGLTDIEDVFNVTGEDANYSGPKVLEACILRSIYVMPIYRGNGFQRDILEHIVGVAEETKECVAAFADPFRINTKRAYETINPLEAIVELGTNGYTALKNYHLIDKQRKAFAAVGFKNCFCLATGLTEQYQHFLFVPSTADDGARAIQKYLELDHQEDYDFFRNM